MKLTQAALLVGAATAALSSTSAKAEIVIGPRVAYYFDNSNLRTSDQQSFSEATSVRDEEREAELEQILQLPVQFSTTDSNSAILADQIGFPMVGAMVNFGDDTDRFTLTGMYGEGTGSADLVSSRSVNLVAGFQEVRDLQLSNLVGQSDVQRVDIEATWQRRLNENFALTAGVRFEQLQVHNMGELVVESTQQILAIVQNDPSLLGLTPPDRFDVESDATYRTYTARFGATAFVPASESVNVFFSGMAQVGYRPSTTVQTEIEFTSSPIPLPEPQITRSSIKDSSEFSVGPDMAVGVQWSIAENLALDVRYRAVVFFPLSGDFEFSDAQVNHGVNLGLSLRL